MPLQTSTYDAERQGFYDSEQHLKSRIQSLSQALKQAHEAHVASASLQEDIQAGEREDSSEQPPSPKEPLDLNDPDNEPAEMTALKLELSTLSTSYTSMQNTLVLLQTQLLDLKRVNNELQEENESYMILLREKTLSGQYNVMKQVGAGSTDDSDEEEDYPASTGDRGSILSAGRRSALDRVEEEDHAPSSLGAELGRSGTLGDEFTRSGSLGDEFSRSGSLGDEFSRNGSLGDEMSRSATLEDEFGRSGDDSGLFEPPPSARVGERKRAGSTSRSLRGETLGDLPISGPGLDLAAELGRAENKDILEGNVVDEKDHSVVNEPKTPVKSKKSRKILGGHALDASGVPLNDIDALKSEVKSLKDANKALSLYAAKIIDRIVSQEGFEHVLAVDYSEPPQTPVTPNPFRKLDSAPKSPGAPIHKPRPLSMSIAGRASTNPGASTPTSSLFQSPPKLGPPPDKPVKTQRRSMSFDWRNFSLFTGAAGEKKPDPPSLRPLSLRPGGSSVVTGARKVETVEDEDDRKERERLNATMKLMGIQPPPAPTQSQTPPIPTPLPPPLNTATPAANPNRRFSFFGRASSTEATPPPQTLTLEALEHAEVENSLAALDTHERNLSMELAKGGGSGFTEIQKKPGGRRSRRTDSAGGSGSGSTVWSMGDDD